MIKLEKEVREQCVRDIQYYFSTEMDEEIGNLAADMMLDFIIKEIGPHIYNCALGDARQWFTSRLADLDVEFMLLEKGDE